MERREKVPKRPRGKNSELFVHLVVAERGRAQGVRPIEICKAKRRSPRLLTAALFCGDSCMAWVAGLPVECFVACDMGKSEQRVLAVDLAWYWPRSEPWRVAKLQLKIRWRIPDNAGEGISALCARSRDREKIHSG